MNHLAFEFEILGLGSWLVVMKSYSSWVIPLGYTYELWSIQQCVFNMSTSYKYVACLIMQVEKYVACLITQVMVFKMILKKIFSCIFLFVVFIDELDASMYHVIYIMHMMVYLHRFWRKNSLVFFFILWLLMNLTQVCSMYYVIFLYLVVINELDASSMYYVIV